MCDSVVLLFAGGMVVFAVYLWWATSMVVWVVWCWSFVVSWCGVEFGWLGLVMVLEFGVVGWGLVVVFVVGGFVGCGWGVV